VAVALQCEPAAEVLNATDTDWWHYRDVLEENGISVRFLSLLPNTRVVQE